MLSTSASLSNNAATSTKRTTARYISRGRKYHHKSRLGCENCKVRRVKCDESRPECTNCLRYGVKCQFYRNEDKALHNRAEEAISLDSPQKPACPTHETFLSMLNSRWNGPKSFDDDDVSKYRMSGYVFSEVDLLSLHHFQSVSVYSIGTEIMSVRYKEVLPGLACMHPALMHAILTFSLLHQRHLTSSSSKPSPMEYYHWSRATLLFNQKLDKPIPEEDYDPVFATATTLSGISVAWTETALPHESWPMTTASDTDSLQWLEIPRGLNSLIPMTQPFRRGSLFYFPPEPDVKERTANAENEIESLISKLKACGGHPHVLSDIIFINNHHPSGGTAIRTFAAREEDLDLDNRISQLVAVCEVTATSTCETNPFVDPLRLLISLLYTSPNLVRRLSFLSAIPAPFVSLLRDRDERALLLMAHWYGLAIRSSEQDDTWWLLRRARLECSSICMFLDRTCADERIRKLMRFPADVCGYRIGEWDAGLRRDWEEGMWFVPGKCVVM